MIFFGPCAFVKEGVVVGIAVYFGYQKDIIGWVHRIKINYASLQVVQAAYTP